MGSDSTPIDPRTVPIVIQAMMDSNIFPGRMLKKIDGQHSMLEFLCQRLREENFHNIIVATTDLDVDVELVKECTRLGIKFVRGPKSDLVQRLLIATETLKTPYFVRVIGSNPLLDISQIPAMIQEHIAGDWQYTYNDHYEASILGTGTEVIEIDLLQQLHARNLTAEQRECGTLFIRQHAHRYRVLRYKMPTGLSWASLSVDTQDDLERIRGIIQEVHPLTNKTLKKFLTKFPIYGISRHQPSKEVGLDKLLFHPDKIMAIQGWQPEIADSTYPISVELSLTNKCNFNCVWCSDVDLRQREDDALDLDILDRLFKDLADNGTQGIVIEGGGEPTVYKQFNAVLDMIDRYGLSKGLITNGSLPLKAEQLSRFDWIRVSLDSSTPTEHKELKGYDGFERILSNIASYVKNCQLVGIGYVVTNKNLGDIETMVLRLKDMCVKYIQFRPAHDHPDLTPEVDLTYLKRYESPTFSVICDGMAENTGQGNSNLPCRAHSLTSVITANGNVYLCGRLNIYDWIKPVGSLLQSSFKEIWLGEERQRQNHLVSEAQFCNRYCPECRISKFNEQFQRLATTSSSNFI
jgi:radical SAM protein with 4Fe4S-binding SPASM domain